MNRAFQVNGMILILGVLAWVTAYCVLELIKQMNRQTDLSRPPSIYEMDGHKFKFYSDPLRDYFGFVSPLPFEYELVLGGVWTASFLANRRLLRKKQVASRRLWLILIPLLLTCVVFLAGAVISSPLSKIIWKGSY